MPATEPKGSILIDGMAGSRRTLRVVVLSLALVIVHATGLVFLGTSAAGSFFSDLMQLIIGVALVVVVFRTAARSRGLACSFWYLTAFAYCAWMVPQALSTYGDIFQTPEVTQSAIKFLFSFWLLPLTMTLCLNEASPRRGFDRLLMLDMGQALLFVIAAYSYFRFNSGYEPELHPSVWSAYFFYYGLLAGAFFLRSILTHSRAGQRLFRRMAFFLLFSTAVDAMYYYGSGSLLLTGSWFDIFWSILLVYPLLMAGTWEDEESEESEDNPSNQVREQLFGRVPGLVFPFSILLMAVHLGGTSIALATILVVSSFSLSTIKHVVTQYRLIKAQEALRCQASHDGLTGAWNHVGILTILERELLRADRTGESLGIIMIDVDHFKAVNDTHGHRCGDHVLKELASQVSSVLRPYDLLGRYGGEEFTIVAPGCDIDKTYELAERIRLRVAGHSFGFNGRTMSVTVSIGIAAYTSGTTLESLLRTADKGLYLAKSHGRNRVELGDDRSEHMVSAIAGSTQ
jgi:diguanylate cyclase (GGDEF)-like protein